jgi:hypothetical protein
VAVGSKILQFFPCEKGMTHEWKCKFLAETGFFFLKLERSFQKQPSEEPRGTEVLFQESEKKKIDKFENLALSGPNSLGNP